MTLKSKTFSFAPLPAILSLIVRIIRKIKILLISSNPTRATIFYYLLALYPKTNFQTITCNHSTKLNSTQYNKILDKINCNTHSIYIFISMKIRTKKEPPLSLSPSQEQFLPKILPHSTSHQPFTIIHGIKSLPLSFSLHQCPHPLDALAARWKVLFQPGGTERGLRLIRNYRRPLFPYRRRTDSHQPPPTRRKDQHQRKWRSSMAGGWNQRLGGVWPSAKKRAAGCASIATDPLSSPLRGKDWKQASRAWTRIIPRPICRRSIHYSSDPWPPRTSRFDSRSPPSLFLSFCTSCRFSGWISRSHDSLLTRQTEEGGSRRRELRHSRVEKLVLSRY